MPPSTPGPQWQSGVVTRSTQDWPVPAVTASPDGPQAPPDAARDRRRMMWIFGGAAGGITILGVVVLLIVVLTGENNPLRPRYSPPSEDLPPLALLCPPPSFVPEPGRSADPTPGPSASAPAGPRTVDTGAGISYKQYPQPWIPWRNRWSAGTLEVAYAIGQHFVTENYGGGSYHASILSGRVAATVNDAMTVDLECTGRQVAADARASYYPQPNRFEQLRDERTELGGLPAWVSTFRLHFDEPGLKAKSELVAVALIDVGRTHAAVLYVSIPETHRQFDWMVEDALASVTPA